jgi:large subunit ribosomal protein L17
MRHNASGRKLGRTTAHRLALFRNQLASLVAQERIVTTVSKAKELRPLAERMITQGKRGTVHARRLVGRWIPNRDLIKKLFDELAPRFSSRAGGYLRIVKLGSRQGDGAEMAVLEFVDFQLKKAGPAAGEKKAKGGRKASKKDETPEELREEPAEKPAAEKKAKPARAAKAPGGRKAEGHAETKPKGKPSGRAAAKSPATKKASGPKKTGGA